MSQVVRGRKTKELDVEKEEKASIKYALLRSFLCLKNVVFFTEICIMYRFSAAAKERESKSSTKGTEKLILNAALVFFSVFMFFQSTKLSSACVMEACVHTFRPLEGEL